MVNTFAVDLFAGAGGLSEGFEQVGINSLLSQELHPQAALTYAFNHPKTNVVYGDIRLINIDSLVDQVNKLSNGENIFMVAGGPPCQGFSSAGLKRKHDPRNSLVKNFIDIVSRLSPKVVLIENVPGFAQRYNGEYLSYALKALDELNYSTCHTIVDASNYGVPQRRIRFMLMGIRKDLEIEPSFPEPVTFLDSFEQDLLLSDLRKTTVGEAISDLVNIKPGTEAVKYDVEPFSGYQLSRRNPSGRLFNHLSGGHRAKALEIFSQIPEGGNIRDVPASIRTKKRTLVRASRSNISNTIFTLPDDLIHYSQDRILTVRETARIQSFDDHYVFLGKRTSCNTARRSELPQYSQIGNAVPPLLAKAVGKHILQLFGIEQTDSRELISRRQNSKLLLGISAGGGYTIPERLPIKLFNSGFQEDHSYVGSINKQPIQLEPDGHLVDTNSLKSSRQWIPQAG